MAAELSHVVHVDSSFSRVPVHQLSARSWPSELQALLKEPGELADALNSLGNVLAGCIPLAALVYFDSPSDSQCLELPVWLIGEEDWAGELALEPLVALGKSAWNSGDSRVGTPLDGLLFTSVAVSVRMRDGVPRALCAVLSPEKDISPERVVEVLEFAALHLSLNREQDAAARSDFEARMFAAILETVQRIGDCDSLKDACRAVVDDMQTFLGCQRIALGLKTSKAGRCRLQAISGMREFDPHSELNRALEAALEETVLCGEPLRWPTSANDRSHGTLAQEQLAATARAKIVLSAPLDAGTSQPIGAWLVLDPPDSEAAEILLRIAQRPVGACLRLTNSGRAGSLSRVALRWRRQTSLRAWTVALSLVLLAAVLLVWPCPHRLACKCELQPVTRRFVAAPFDGTLEKSFVKPGDVVAEDQVLARMDGREIGLELAALDAEFRRSQKKWEASLALDEIYEAQQAKLEMQRLQSKTAILRQRQKNLEIKSPRAGIVVAGDLQRSEGAPLTIGQTLFEVAPLSHMKVEVAIPEADIAHVREGMAMQVHIDAVPRTKFTATLQRIVPRAEIREDAFVFIGDTELDNAAGNLRPGMSGRATLIGSRRRMAWLLFHKPFESLLMWLGW